MYRYNAANCAQYVGRVVAVHTRCGIYRGRIDRVGPQGIYLTPMVARTVEGEVDNETLLLDNLPSTTDAEEVFWGWGWGGGFWLPFLSILALSPLLFW
jgi:hypothetical protein